MTGDEPTTFEIDGPAALERRLASITAAKREASRIRSRIAEVEAELESLDAEYGAAVQRLEGEEADVRKLAGFSFTGLIADLRGSREEALEREIAEAAAARLEVATLLERQDAEVRELSSLQDRLVALGDPDVEWQDALADRERWVEVHGGETAERLARIATEMGDLDDEMRECEEAREVAGEALSRLDGVAEALGAAEDWSGFDTWFGGGVFTRSEKHDQLDEASRRIHEAEDSLRRLSKELADIGEEVGSAVTVDRWDRAFDEFFDDVYSDASMRRRIGEALALVDHAQERVGRIAADVEERSRLLSQRIAALQEERAELLAARPAEM
ncbi:MAG: hypothetical protein KDB02_02135 [Acidimicrobiales bacterium]|nr:hypothetical protein [Acidimicrobiales bacterium]